jgi:hypothetical protein
MDDRLDRDTFSETAASHPEEMKGTLDLTIGKSVSIKAVARATPAGLVAAALLTAAIFIPIIWLASGRRRGYNRMIS